MGRPTFLTPEILVEVEELAELGLNDKSIAEAIGVHPITLGNQKNGYVQSTLIEGKIGSDSLVGLALKRGRAKWRRSLAESFREGIARKGKESAALLIFSAKQKHGLGYSDAITEDINVNVDVSPAAIAWERRLKILNDTNRGEAKPERDKYRESVSMEPILIEAEPEPEPRGEDEG